MVAGILENRRSQIIDERPHQYGRAREKLFDISARAAELIPMSRAHDLAQGMRQRIAYIQEDR